jgi:hypothetical protein
MVADRKDEGFERVINSAGTLVRTRYDLCAVMCVCVCVCVCVAFLFRRIVVLLLFGWRVSLASAKRQAVESYPGV